MLDNLLEMFERDKKSSSKRSGGLRGRLATMLDGERGDRYHDRDRDDDDRSRRRDRDDDDRYQARGRDDDNDRYRSRDRDDDDRYQSRDRDDDRYDDDRPTSRKKKREFDLLDFGD